MESRILRKVLGFLSSSLPGAHLKEFPFCPKGNKRLTFTELSQQFSLSHSPPFTDGSGFLEV
jgi:hypothetical protein